MNTKNETMEKTNYNGWTNYETWNVNLWIDNDRELYETFTSLSRNKTTYQLSKIIQNFIEENNPISETASLYNDILSSALREVNYYEIAENIKEGTDLEETIN